MAALRTIPLPTVEEVLAEIPGLLVASGELSPRRLGGAHAVRDPPDHVYPVLRVLSPAWSNPDVEPELGAVDEIERQFLSRQIERTHRDAQLEPSRPSPWVLSDLAVARLTDGSSHDQAALQGMLCLEVPVLTMDRRRAVLRGQRCESRYAEDFEHRLEKVHGRWMLSS